jgi:hypothetical protein
LKNKNEIIFKHSQPKPWALIKDEYLFKFDKKFPNLTITNLELFCERHNNINININSIQVQ